MAGLRLFTSNRLERLAESLAELTRHPLASPLQPEIVVVQSQGMARWVTLEIARRNQICANYQFPFPKIFLQSVFGELFPDLENAFQFERDVMAWKIMELLPQFLMSPEFAPLKHYLAGENAPLKLYQLSQKIAGIFDQYLTFRPEMILLWESGKEEHWQSILWRELTKDRDSVHIARLELMARKILENGKPFSFRKLPERISIFGISSLPPLYINLFSAVAEHLEINFFLLQPTPEYWGDLLSKREAQRLLRKNRHISETDAHFSTGHPLLASWGKIGRDFLDIVLDAKITSQQELFEAPEPTNLLQQLQTDIFQLDEARRENKVAIESTDRSIEFHSCHSPLREMEVLYDHVLDWLQKNPQLSPRDILVMLPDVESYTPFIQTVFDCPENESKRIPFSIADRSARDEGQVLKTFLAILELHGSRCGVREILSLLECIPLQKRFAFEERDLEIIQRWIEETRIRWGMDTAHRTSFGLPDFAQNSWDAGINRLLLGYAMIGENEHLFADILPYDALEGVDALVLGRFLEFMDKLTTTLGDLKKNRPLVNWIETLQFITSNFFASDDNSENEIQFIRVRLEELGKQQSRADFSTPIGIEIILAHLKNLMQEAGFNSGFITGGITFCALKPMRSLPFKIICLAGMRDGAFPRYSSPLGFDLMKQNPRRGDPSMREDDRYLFLEAILSAREKLYLSYVGQSAKDNSPLPPSVLIDELKDCLNEQFSVDGENSVSEHLTTKHRLQPFSEEYFTGGRLFSYSAENCRARFIGKSNSLLPFIGADLAEPEAEWRTLDIKTLVEFFSNPAKFFLKKRLGLEFIKPEEQIGESEPFSLHNLDNYALKQQLVEKKIAGVDVKKSLAIFQASGAIPVGRIGESSYLEMNREVDSFLQRLQRYHITPTQTPLLIHLSISGFTLQGQLENLGANGLIQFRCAKVKPKDYLRAWISHLVLNAQKPADIPLKTYLVATDGVFEFRPVEDVEKLLAELLELYWQGLMSPLRFFPMTSLAYMKAIIKDEATAMSAAQKVWDGNEYMGGGEKEDEWLAHCFQDASPLGEDFETIARKVFQPMLSHMEEVKE